MPVIGLPGIFQPRAAVAYMFTAAAEVAALAGAAPARPHRDRRRRRLPRARGEALRGPRRRDRRPARGRPSPVVYGADLTAPVARRWKCQVNENAKLPAFFSELPEADHNEICGWDGAADAGLAAVFLEDSDQHPRVRRRFELTAAAVGRWRRGGPGRDRRRDPRRPPALGDDAGRPGLARARPGRGVDPLPVEAIERFKEAMGRP